MAITGGAGGEAVADTGGSVVGVVEPGMTATGEAGGEAVADDG
jgi:hypothetical protein